MLFILLLLFSQNSNAAGQTAQKIFGTVSVSSMPAVAVTGTLTNTELRASAVPVSFATAPTTPVTGTFWQATQPVSFAALPSLVAGSAVIGHVIVDSAPSTTVSGTVAATQSGTWTVQPGNTANTTAWKVDGSAVTQPVSGSFYQATQPVSIASMPSTPVTGTFYQVTQPVSGTFWQTTQPVSIATAPALVASSAVIGHVINDASAAVIGHVIVDATSTTIATQATAASLNATVVGTGTFVTQSNIADGASVTLGAKADAKSTATDTTAITAMQVLKQISASVQAPPSQAVTNAGVFVVQAAESDGANVTLGAKADAKSTATDTTAITAMSVLKQISASVQAPPSQAVTNTGTFVTQSTLAPETTKVIGTVNVAAAQTIALAAGSAVVGHVIHDSGSTTVVTGTVTSAEAITGGNPCQNPQATLVSITGATSTNNATQIIALSGSTKIYICALTVVGVSGTAPTFSLVQGTGSNCVTGQTVVVQAFATTANQSYLFSGPVSVGTAGNALCYKDGGTSPIENYQITYVQQ